MKVSLPREYLSKTDYKVIVLVLCIVSVASISFNFQVWAAYLDIADQKTPIHKTIIVSEKQPEQKTVYLKFYGNYTITENGKLIDRMEER